MRSCSVSHCALAVGKLKASGYSLRQGQQEQGGKRRGGGRLGVRGMVKARDSSCGRRGRQRPSHDEAGMASSEGGGEEKAIRARTGSMGSSSSLPVQEVSLQCQAVGVLGGRAVEQRGPVSQAEGAQVLLDEVLPLRLLEAAALLLLAQTHPHAAQTGE